jgi:hypothetical protein
MTPSNANTSGLVFVAWRRRPRLLEGRPWIFFDEASDVEFYTAVSRKTQYEVEPLVTAPSAQARIAELEAETDVLKVEVIGLRAAIFGSHDYDPTLRHGNFIEMARATEDGRQGAVARAAAAEARADRLAKALTEISENSAAAGWSRDLALAALQQEG